MPGASERRRGWRVVQWVAVVLIDGLASGLAVWSVMGRRSAAGVDRAPRHRLAGDRIVVVSHHLRVGPLFARVAGHFPGRHNARLRRSEVSPGSTRLYLRSLDPFDPRPLEGTEGASAPFFSPDGQSVGFFSAGRFRLVSPAGARRRRSATRRRTPAAAAPPGVRPTRSSSPRRPARGKDSFASRPPAARPRP